MAYAISLHGVLQTSQGAPNPQGIALYHAMSSIGRLIVLGGLDVEKDAWFLATNNLTTHILYEPEVLESGPTELDRRSQQISRIRASGMSIDLLVDPDPSVIAMVHDRGLAAMLYLHPKFTQPAFRPDYKSEATPWQKLLKSVEYQERLKVAAASLFPDDEDDE